MPGLQSTRHTVVGRVPGGGAPFKSASATQTGSDHPSRGNLTGLVGPKRQLDKNCPRIICPK
eukprot:757490-Hanusia_phi.AAC.4